MEDQRHTLSDECSTSFPVMIFIIIDKDDPGLRKTHSAKQKYIDALTVTKWYPTTSMKHLVILNSYVLASPKLQHHIISLI